MPLDHNEPKPADLMAVGLCMRSNAGCGVAGRAEVEEAPMECGPRADWKSWV